MISPMEFTERHTQRPLCGFQIYRRYVCNGSIPVGRDSWHAAGKQSHSDPSKSLRYRFQNASIAFIRRRFSVVT